MTAPAPMTEPAAPFRAEHVGSFLRPAALLAARERHEAGEIARDELRAAEDAAIRDVVRLQHELGLQSITDGEYRRSTYSDSFTTAGLDGVTADFTGEGNWAYRDRHGHRTAARIPTVTGRIVWQGSRNAADFAFLAGLVEDGRLPKMTLPGPAYIHYRGGRAHIDSDAYPDLDDFWSDLVAAYRSELRALYDAGCRYVQLDETSLAKLGDPKIRAALKERGDDWEDLLDIYAEAINAVVAGAPDGMGIGIHLCRGNNQGHWQADGGYDAIAAALFRKVEIGGYFLEYDSPRAGTFEPLREVPEGKKIVLGLVSTKTAEIEERDAILRRIEEASRIVPLDRLCLSPQCGFASSFQGNPLGAEQQNAKLRLVVDIAKEVWG
ncbi:MAG: 5-methyltetrahydropteroyltriglutamate--homocysteine S-methyltransferase [Rhodospirillaceae bacterium]